MFTDSPQTEDFEWILRSGMNGWAIPKLWGLNSVAKTRASWWGCGSRLLTSRSSTLPNAHRLGEIHCLEVKNPKILASRPVCSVGFPSRVLVRQGLGSDSYEHESVKIV